MSFRLKLTLGIALVEALLMAMLFASMLNYQLDAHKRQQLLRASSTSALVQGLLAETLKSGDRVALAALSGQLLATHELSRLTIIDPQGEVIVNSGAPQDPDRSYSLQREILLDGVSYGELNLILDSEELRTEERELMIQGIVWLLLGVGLLWLFAVLLGSYMTRQLAALTRAAHEVGLGHLDYRVPLLGADELADTARAFNEMAGQLQQNVARLEAILELTLDAVIILDVQGRIQQFNPAAERLLGFDQESVRDRPLRHLLPELHQALRSASVGSEPFEGLIKTHGGELLPVELSIAQTETERGPLRFINLRDLRNRITREENLNKMMRAVEQSPTSVVITDIDATIEYVNQHFVDVTGYTFEEAVGKNPRILKSGRTPPETYDQMWSSLLQGESWQGELINRKKSGVLYWEQVIISPIRDHHDVITHYVAVKEDITERKRVENALRTERDFSMRIISRAPGIILGIDRNGDLRFINRAGEQISGYQRTELQGYAWRDKLFPGALGEQTMAMFELQQGGADLREFEAQIKPRSGQVRTILWNTVHRYDQQGELVEILAFGDDITQQKAIEQHVRSERAFLQDIIDGVADPIMVIDINYKVLLMNRAAGGSDLSRVNRTQSMPTCYQLSHHQDEPCHSQEHPCPLREVIDSGKPSTVIHLHYDARGEPRQYELVATPLRSDNGDLIGIIESSRDVTEHMHTIELMRDQRLHMQHLAQHDMLTGLPNRMLFLDLLSQAIRDSRRYNKKFAVLFLDLDRFKQVNDSLGHAVGDHLLQEVAQRLSATLRDEDTVGRIGGDEFVLLILNLQEVDAAALVAEKLLNSLRQVVEVDGHQLHVTSSIGISIYPQDALDGESLMKSADAAMYRAKQLGRNAYQFFSREMTDGALEQLTLESHLIAACEEKRFELHYQPQVDLETGRLLGVEALLRWNDPQLGDVEPSQFIPLAEESGLIRQIDSWVLRQACQQYVEWKAEGIEVGRIAVNLSPVLLQDESLVEAVRETLEFTGCPAEVLELEITEGAFMRNTQQAIKILLALRELGIQLAIDDFGTGYSSLTYLKLLPLTRLKIDQSFINNLSRDSEDLGIVSAIIAMAGHMRIQVIAEGIEQIEQRSLLLESGCGEGQGFLFSRAVPASEISQFVRRGGQSAAQPDAQVE